jgi:hypothetical protein
MLQRLRFLVSLALFIALPIQGVAAVAGSLCMALEGNGAGSHAAGTAAHEHDGEAGGSSHDHQPGQDGDTASHSHCGPCVACCASAAIAGGLVFPLASAVASAPQVVSLPEPKTLRRDKLDRPPLAT